MRRFSIVLLLAAALWQPATALPQSITVNLPFQSGHVYDGSKPFIALTPGTTQTGHLLDFFSETHIAKPGVATFTTGGTGSFNYYAQAVWIDYAGRPTIPGNQASFLGHGNRTVIHPPAVGTGVAGWLPYVSHTTATETLQSVAGNCTTVTIAGVTACGPAEDWTAPASGLTIGGARVPTLNSAFVLTAYFDQNGNAFGITPPGAIAVVPFVSQTGATYNVQVTDQSVSSAAPSGNTVFTLPHTGLAANQIIRISNNLAASANVTVNVDNGAAIGNSVNGTSDVLWATGAVAVYQWDGSEWWVVGH